MNVTTGKHWCQSKVWGYVAAFSMITYATLKTLWAFEIPLGWNKEGIAKLHMSIQNEPVIGFLYSLKLDITVLLALIAATLGIALVQPWGEVFSRWVPFLNGKKVPLWLIISPAWVVGGFFIFINFQVLPSIILWILGFTGPLNTGGMSKWAVLTVYVSFGIWGVTIVLSGVTYIFRNRVSKYNK
jgi:hypothetical protein